MAVVSCGAIVLGAVSECEVRSPDWDLQEVIHPGFLHPSTSPEFSPDGQHIVFGFGEAIYVVNLVEARLHRLPDGPSTLDYFMQDYSPQFSPDGSRVAYSTYRFSTGLARNHSFEIATSRPDGTDAKALTRDEFRDRAPAWSPDGSSIAFLSRRDGSREIYLMASDGSDVVRIADVGGLDAGLPVWSPDGVHIAFRGYDTELRGNNFHQLPFIAVVRRDGTGFRKMIESESWLSRPSWSPDGRRMAVLGVDEDGTVVIHTLDIGGWNLQQVFVGSQPSKVYGNQLRGIAWSSDGSEIRFYGAAPEFGLHAINPDGTGLRTLLSNLPDEAELSSPRGDRIAVLTGSRADHGEVVLYTLTVEGAYRQNLVRNVHGKLLAEISEVQAPIR